MRTEYIVASVSILLLIIITFFILSRRTSSINCEYTPTPSNASFSPCSAKECGTTGIQTRPKYLILSQPSNGGNCTQKDIMETTPCSAVPCPVDFKYTPSNGGENIKKDIRERETTPVDCTYAPSNALFSPCSAKDCGTTGIQTRPKYLILSQPSNGGNCTQKDIMETTPCSAVPCPVDCTYTPSNASFSPCSAKECKTTGIQNRLKYKIISPSMYGGKCTQENEYDIVTCRSLACPTLYDNYVNNINFIRSFPFDLPGAGWTDYYGKHPVPVESMEYIINGVITTTREDLISGVKSNIAEFKLDEYRADPIQWSKIPYNGTETFWYILTGCLTQFMKTLDKQYINLFMRITSDYFKNNKEAVKGVDRNQYSDYAPWLLSLASSIVNILNELGGFLKFIGKQRMSTSEFDSIWKIGSTYFYTNEPPLDDNQIRQLLSESFSPEVYSNIRKGMLVDHSKELIINYKYRGKVPNQRLEGLLALLMMSHMFKNYCDDDVTNYNYEYTVADENNNTYNTRLTRLSEIVVNINMEANEGISMFLGDQFWDDGPMIESSLNYNIGGITKLKEIKRYADESINNTIDKIISKFNDFLDAITTQNNILPPIGNVSQQGTTRVPGVVYTESVYFPLSGFSVLRNRDLYLFMNYGILTRGHKVNSSYYVVLSAFNKMLFTMGGPSTYEELKAGNPLLPVKPFFEEDCSFKSCSWVVDNLNRSSIYYNKVWQSLTGINAVTNILLGTRFGLSDNFDFVQHSMDVEYGLLFGTSLKKVTTKVKVNFSRCIVLSKSDNIFYIIDKITPSDSMKHTYTHPWIFNMDFLPENVTLMKDGFYTTQPNSVNVQVKYYNNTVLTHNLYYNQLDSTIPVKTSNSSFVNSNLGPLGYTSTGIGRINPSVNILSMSDSITGPMISIAQIAPYNSTTPPSTFNSVCTVDETSGILVKSSSSQLKLGWNTSSFDGFYGINNVKISDIISR